MPNWCNNFVKIEGPRELIEDLAEVYVEGKLLQTLRPEPEGVDWYNWRLENWGTKWDISKYDDVEIKHKDDGTSYFEIYFNSAWSPPVDAFQYAEENNEDLTITAYYYEGGNCFAGRLKDGEDITIKLDEDADFDYFENDELGQELDEHFEITRQMIEYLEWEAGDGVIIIFEEEP